LRIAKREDTITSRCSELDPARDQSIQRSGFPCPAGAVTFVLGKIIWTIAAPGNFLVLMLSLGTLSLVASGGRRGLAWIALATLTLVSIAMLPLGEWLMTPLENRFPAPAELPARIDGVVVLGGAIEDAVSEARSAAAFNQASARVAGAALLVHRYPAARVVLAGGDSHLVANGLSEAVVMQRFLTDLGVDPGRIATETRSRTTFENAVFTYAEIEPKLGETWILVTSASHMPRAVGSFRHAGWSVLPYPVDYRTTGEFSLVPPFSLSHELTLVTAALREWIGLAAYRAMGRTDALFPAPE
jgi:uncharacterized SAM-binding protein YcdF (DUF218 family)